MEIAWQQNTMKTLNRVKSRFLHLKKKQMNY